MVLDLGTWRRGALLEQGVSVIDDIKHQDMGVQLPMVCGDSWRESRRWKEFSWRMRRKCDEAVARGCSYSTGGKAFALHVTDLGRTQIGSLASHLVSEPVKSNF